VTHFAKLTVSFPVISLAGRAMRARSIVLSSQLAALAIALMAGGPAFGSLMINPTYNDAAMSSAGLTAGQIASVHTAFAAAVARFTSNFSDPINININVTAVAGTGTLGTSNTSLLGFSYASVHTALAGDSKTADDATSLAAGGSVPAVDPVGGTHLWWTSRAEAKAIGLQPDDLLNDGTFTFGAGYNYSFDPNSVGAGQYDFEGVAMHEISEIMGRIGLFGITLGGRPAGEADYMLYDLFHYTGAGTRSMTNGGGIYFSIDNGTTNLKGFNNASVNGGDASDWASGANDSFNAFSNSGVQNPLTLVDFRVMDVIGYDRTFAAPVPEPSTGMLLLVATGLAALIRRRVTS
jgi:hypothetical protein